MNKIQIIQVLIAIFLMIAILLQSRGAGLSGIFGGSNNIYLTKRGLEKKLFVVTVILSVLFFTISLTGVILAK